MKYDVFISCKSEDYKQVREIYEVLVNNGLKVFLADAELRKLGNAQYGKVIDAALDSAKHLIVFATKPEYVRSEYVENEWRMFLEEKRSGRKTGNLMSIIQFPIGELPISLRTTQSFPFIKFKDILSFLPIESKTEASESTAMESEESLNAIFKHSKDNNSDQPSKNDKSHDNNKNVFGKVVKRPPLHNKWLICTIIIIFFIVYIIYNQNFNKPNLPQLPKDTIPETKHLILDTLHLNDSISQIEDSISLKEFSIADIENQIIDTMYQKDIKKQVPENFILIPSGTLYKFRDKYDNEFHQYIYRDIPLDAFYICKHEVTQEEYEQIMGSNPSQIRGNRIPVNTIQFIDAIKYCNARSIVEGYDGFYTICDRIVKINPNSNGYRLPNKYEWAYAARKDEHTKTKYASGDNIKDIAWYGGNSNNTLHPICTKSPNGRGIYDMNGNVSEWLWEKDFDGYNCSIGSDFMTYISFGESDAVGIPVCSEENGFRVTLITREQNNSNIENLLTVRHHLKKKQSILDYKDTY